MTSDLCNILVIEDDPAKIGLIQRLLSESEHSSLAQGLSFTLTIVNSLQAGLEKLTTEEIHIILLDITLPDSQGVNALIRLREEVPKIPILIESDSDDENIAVQAFQLGADGYLQTQNLDPNLFIYQIRLALERQQYIAKSELHKQQQQQEQEFKVLETFVSSNNTMITGRMFGSQPLRESVPDIFREMVQTYGKILDLALEQRAYKVEHNISDSLRMMADKLGFLKASPRDVVEIHTTTLREKNQDVTLAKAQAHVSEGRLMVLELMGYLTAFYRKYYIGLSTINMISKSDHK